MAAPTPEGAGPDAGPGLRDQSPGTAAQPDDFLYDRPLAPRQATEAAHPGRLQCPSAPPEWPNAATFGIVVGTPQEPRVRYLKEPLPVPENLPYGLTPREVVRISADCVEGGCRHWTGDACSLVTRVIGQFEPVTLRLPPCGIRIWCRWWDQEGPAACQRCPGIPTDTGDPSAGVDYL